MMKDLSLTLIQTSLHWEEPVANLAMLEEKLWRLEGSQEVVLLPEMFNTGFTMNAEKVAEPMGLTTFRWMKQQAQRMDAVIAGSYIVKESGKFYNRFIWMQPDGDFQYYDKRHLFRMAEEHDTFSAGQERLIISYKGWRICPMVCYDLRFPVWSRNNLLENGMEYDLLLYVANWPAPRKSAWEILLKGRAIENLAYCAGVNRIGVDGNETSYEGSSVIIDPKGNVLSDAGGEEGVCSAVLSREQLESYRTKFPAYLDADRFEIKK
jgi:predicted amidohydrolase